jgi:ubiquinone/menaquinone biosynthesis C-methylase UbiE
MLKILYKMLEDPKVYDLSQKLLGGDRVFRTIKEAIAVHLSGISYNNVLDVGCGTGLFMDCFKGKYTGIDINQEYIRRAEAKGKGVFLVADATVLPFVSETFDLIFTLGLLHHLDTQDRKKMLDEMKRICKTDGYIFIMDGLVPSNRLNVIGYILAKLDRGRFKMKIKEFKEMIETSYSQNTVFCFRCYHLFPYEFAVLLLKKNEMKKKEN